MSFIRSIFAIAIMLGSSLNYSFAHASVENEALKRNITALITSESQLPAAANVVQIVTIVTSISQLKQLCENPDLSLAGSSRRLTGNRSVVARCGNLRKFIQVKVAAEGEWWTAAHPLKPASVIQEDDLMLHTGSLDHQPADLLFDKSSIIGQTTTRTINAGQAITQSELRHPWLAVAGQEVEILAQGDGFQIRTRGKALTNAAANKTLRVSMRNGQIINGIVEPDGTVSINLKE
ncbi:flagellar basal body P-ring formation protein FlgA [Pluralibacter gergoviae]|nr:flagellar basal body P-ring formation protein FlgA [Pluralibacter gergoviae]ELW9440016.1 flagellar basal body P-ring formation protein FlgA [Pluralibacter gergoviae]